MADEVQIRFGADIGDALSGIDALKQAVAGIGEPLARLRGAFAETNAAFAAGERAKLDEARGDWGRVQAIYRDWAERAKAQFGDTSVAFALVQREMMLAAQRQGEAAYQAAERRAAEERRLDSETLAAFKANMRELVDARRLSLSQALGFDLDYSAQLQSQERARLEAIMQNEADAVGDRLSAFRQLHEAGSRYAVEAADDQRRLADAARREADRFAQPFRQAFDEIGAGFRSTVTGLIEGTLTWRGAALQAAQSVERAFVGMVESAASKAAAGPLGSLLGVGAAPGEGVADVLGNALGKWLFGAPQQLGQTAAMTANTAALAANTSALAALAATLGGTVGATAGVAAAGTAEAGAAAGGAGIFGGLFSLFGFARGGIVPSAAQGWALPSFAGAVPALLHSREMVLPAPISQGLQAMIAGGGSDGGGAAHFHAHFHGPADAPAIARWFRDNMRANAGTIRDLFRSNALTPRTL